LWDRHGFPLLFCQWWLACHDANQPGHDLDQWEVDNLPFSEKGQVFSIVTAIALFASGVRISDFAGRDSYGYKTIVRLHNSTKEK
jgi:hypothetical protein